MFSVKKFLEDNFQDVDGVLGLLAKHTQIELPNRETARRWFQRNSIPGDWAFMLLFALEQESGQPVAIAPYIGEENTHDIFA